MRKIIQSSEQPIIPSTCRDLVQVVGPRASVNNRGTGRLGGGGARGDSWWSSKIVGPDGSTRSPASVTSSADPVAAATPTGMISY